MAAYPEAGPLPAARRAMQRAAAKTRLQLRRGLSSLDAVAQTALFLGVIGTSFGALASFRGCAGNEWTCIAGVINGLTEAPAPLALSLAVAIPAFLCCRYLNGHLAQFELEMNGAALEVLNQLSRLRRAK